jgi:hypothetical protein
MRLYLSLLSLLFLINCGANDSGDSGSFTISILSNPSQSEWRFANYIGTQENGFNPSSRAETTSILERMVRDSVDIEFAWVREYSPTCGDLDMVVPNQIVVQISGNPSAADLHPSLTRTSNPDLPCPISVVKYSLN